MKDNFNLSDEVSVELGTDPREPFISSEDALALEDETTLNPPLIILERDENIEGPFQDKVK